MTHVKTFFKVAAFMLATYFLVACDKGFEPEVEFPEGTVAFKAIVDGGADTRTVMEEGENNRHDSKWYGEEAIQILGQNGSYKFTASISSPSSSATFTYAGDFEEDKVMAVYPAGSYAADFDKMSVSGVTIPSKQTAVAGSYDPDAVPAVAYSTDNTLQFKNVPALLKFTMGSDGVKNVTVWGDMTEVELEGDMPDFYQEGNVYLTIDSQWLSDGARIAAYFWGGSGEKWESMEPVAGQANMYTCAIPSGRTDVIFCRMSSNLTNNWSNKWNQTVDLKLSEGNHFTITNPWDESVSDKKATGSWSTFSAETIITTAGISGTGRVYYNDGKPVMEGASDGYVSLNGDFKKGKTYYIAVAPVVFENGFTVEFSNEGDYNKYEVKSTTKRVQFKRNVVHDLGTLVSGKDTGFFTEPAIPDADKACTIYFRPETGDVFDGYESDLYAHVWLKDALGADIAGIGSTWNDNDDKYRLAKVGDNLWSMSTGSQTLREWFDAGTNPVQKVGIIARTSDGETQTDDNFIKVTDSKYGVYNPLPAGVKHGINYIDNSTVTLVLYDRDNKGKAHDFCNLLWDENWWGDTSKPKTPLHYDDESGCWWITLTDLDPDKQYKFQYQLGYGSNVTVTTFDPYTEIVYDRSNDQWISSTTYPNLAKEYGDTHYGRDNGFVSAFKINRDVYDWKVEDYDIEDRHDLVIYELLVRDFTDNAYGEGSIKAALGQLDYLKTLGVNAIELMPIQEFDGNDSWGYGNHAYFALDKAYGTRKDYKDFIDACHQNRIAVILDVVYNHATGAHPYAAMYWDGTKTASNNPWFNVDAPHQWSVYHDWNHSNPMVREHVKRSLTYLMEEYKIDGFRFDLTKGFTQNSGTEGSYDQSRVDILKEYNAHIRSVDDDAVMICEHFVDDENWELGKDGILVWRNMNHPYTKAMRRNMSEADFYGTTNGFNADGTMADWNNFGMLVGFQESHDEERTNYLGQWEDNSGPSIPLATRMERAKINAAFFLLSPGPKMIWQFGEIGYDISIEDNGRTGKKPCKTAEYMAVKERKALYDTYAMLIKFRKDNPRFFDYDVNFRWYVGGNEQTGRYLFARSAEGKHFALFGNFGTGSKSIGVELPAGVEKWYDYQNKSSVWNGSSHTTTMAEGQFYLLVSDPDMCLE